MSPARNALANSSPRYERHQPEQTLLYQLVEQHYPAFKASLEAQGHRLPHHIQREFDDFLYSTLAEQYGFAIIEDDVYGDLAYRYPRPRTIKSLDQSGVVLLCSSFSKTLAPGLRVGWVSGGKFGERLLHQKYVSSASCASLPQQAVAEFIAQGGYERHVRKMRQQYQTNRDHMLHYCEKYFPVGTRLSFPAGGFLLWVEFPDGIDCGELNRELNTHGISIAPAQLFSASGKCRNCCRLNFVEPQSTRIQRALQQIGRSAQALQLSYA